MFVAFFAISMSSCGYNSMVEKERKCGLNLGSGSKCVSTKSRFLFPTIIPLKGAADFEKSTLTAVIEARQKRQHEMIASQLDAAGYEKIQASTRRIIRT